MKRNLLTVMTVIVLFFCIGCGKKKSAADPELLKALKQPVKCSKCHAETPMEEYGRVSQVLRRCPACRNVINIMEARDGKKKK